MKNLLLVCAGGAVGSGARYLVGLAMVERFGKGFPWGTLCVNLVGCLLLGAIMRASEKSGAISPALLLTLTVGVMGGFTTYSSFNFETFRMLQDGRSREAIVYVLMTLGGGFLAGAAGHAGARAALD